MPNYRMRGYDTVLAKYVGWLNIGGVGTSGYTQGDPGDIVDEMPMEELAVESPPSIFTIIPDTLVRGSATVSFIENNLPFAQVTPDP
jgi:hypothetical protein